MVGWGGSLVGRGGGWLVGGRGGGREDGCLAMSSGVLKIFHGHFLLLLHLLHPVPPSLRVFPSVGGFLLGGE